MFRLALLFISSAIIGSCNCTPLPCPRGTCPDEAKVVAEAIDQAERRWIAFSECRGTGIGASSIGNWVMTSTLFCEHTDYFDGDGDLRATRSCCEGQCTQYGIGTIPVHGRQLRDLCAEARAVMVVVGVSVTSRNATLWTEDGQLLPFKTVSDDRQWILPPGRYVAEEKGASQRFELPADGGFQPVMLDGDLRVDTYADECVVFNNAVGLRFRRGFARDESHRGD